MLMELMKSVVGRSLSVFIVLAVGTAGVGYAQQPQGATRVFNRFAESVVEIHVMENNSQAKVSAGSGFFVTDEGHIVTNYHVVSTHVLEPDDYEVRVVLDDIPASAIVLAVDAVHDLALLEVPVSGTKALQLRSPTVDQGDRLFSFGYPGDLGITIVEGTYNGFLEHAVYDRIHFTGSLNPGMSGGPTVRDDGVVVGINVATAGNQLSFLVPVSHARSLLSQAAEAGYTPPTTFLPVIGEQIRRHQDTYLGEIMASPLPTVQLGIFSVPTQPAAFFECWGDTYEDDDGGFEYIDHQCGTDDYLFISNEYDTGVFQLFHRVISAESFNPFRFYGLYTESFQANSFYTGGDRENVTPFRCHTRNVRRDDNTMKAMFCARRLRRFEGLYDVIVKAAAIGVRKMGLETTLQLSAVTFENAQEAARRYLEGISWSR
jgi:S1-C subfamily serine protease